MPGDVKPHAVELAKNVYFLERKLSETRDELETQEVVIPYDNGGGQRGIRKNPIFDGYNQLMQNYRKSLEQLCSMLRTYGGKSECEQKNPLAQILAEAEAVLANG